MNSDDAGCGCLILVVLACLFMYKLGTIQGQLNRIEEALEDE